ncbi:MAG: nicotinate (nicotinamide) nucleotide adenylyltransferase [Bacteroidales bacterium]|nr:nicotinate (nicotinamide) nucleotide adenylyltransferase [Bacteroidales bacterium]
MPSTLKTGLFFGTFNPIHAGHLIIANYMVECTDLKEVWFVITPQNPLKNKSTLLKDNLRFYMVNLAIEDTKKFKACDIEFKLPKPSYTINTLTYLKEKYPDKNFVLIMGSDNLKTFHKWKNYKQILEDYELYIYPRPVSDGGVLKNHKNVKILNAPLIEISSSFIRKSIKEKKDVRFFLTDKVYRHITEMHFYEK